MLGRRRAAAFAGTGGVGGSKMRVKLVVFEQMHSGFKLRPSLAAVGNIINFNRPAESSVASSYSSSE